MRWRTKATIALAIAALAPAAPASPGRAAEPSSPWLGVGIEAGESGVRITEIIDGTPAERAGLARGDEILALGEIRVRTPRQLVAAVARHDVGDEVELSIARGGATIELPAVLAARLSAGEVLQRRLVGEPAPGFELPAVTSGDSGRLASLRGQVVVLEFWATWCKPCATTHEALDELARERGHEGLSVLAISGESEAALRAYVNRESPEFAVLRDPSGSVRKDYHASTIPLLVVVGRDGIIRYAGVGAGLNLDHALFAAERALREQP